MQLYAMDLQHNPVFAEQASKGSDYLCPECQGKVRVRGGVHRRTHFYHISKEYACSQHYKSMAHIQTQVYLEKALPLGEVSLEHRFLEISRIADVVWFPQKLVFEVQCSPISKEEVSNRNVAYMSIGYQVIWVLHDKRFNQTKLSAAEAFLKDAPHYYTNIDSAGSGYIYDQFSLIVRGVRNARLDPLPIDISKPYVYQGIDPFRNSLGLSKLPPSCFVENRLNKWPCGFIDDIVHLAKTDPEHVYLKKITLIEDPRKRSPSRILYYFSLLVNFVVRVLQTVGHITLERACK